jgi:hypothetical protein
MPALSEMFSLDSESLALASGHAVAPGFVLSTLLSTTTSTNQKGVYIYYLLNDALNLQKVCPPWKSSSATSPPILKPQVHLSLGQ